MSITIVAALPTPTASAGADNSANAGDSASPQGFASLLLGQLFPATPGTPALTITQSSIVSEAAGEDRLAEGTSQEGPMALLATLSQIPVEQRNQASAPSLQISSNVTDTEKPALALTATSTGNVAQGSETKVTDTDKPALALTASSTGNVAQGSETDPAHEKANLGVISDPSALTANSRAAKFAVLPGRGQIETPLSTAPLSTEPSLAAHESAASVASLTTHSPHTQAARETSLSVPTPLRDQNWSQDFSQKIVWLASNQKQSAELTLNPPHMGAIEISLHVDNDKATASFASANASVREAIETALPRLREMLSGVGIELGQANVSAESFRQASGQENGNNDSNRARSDTAILTGDSHAAQSAGTIVSRRGVGLVDTFA